MRLARVRPCDGACCREAPRFPNSDHSDCIYHDARGCALQRDPGLIPEGACPALPRMTATDAVILTCLQWPHNMPRRGTGGCCWQWVN